MQSATLASDRLSWNYATRAGSWGKVLMPMALAAQRHLARVLGPAASFCFATASSKLPAKVACNSGARRPYGSAGARASAHRHLEAYSGVHCSWPASEKPPRSCQSWALSSTRGWVRVSSTAAYVSRGQLGRSCTTRSSSSGSASGAASAAVPPIPATHVAMSSTTSASC